MTTEWKPKPYRNFEEDIKISNDDTLVAPSQIVRIYCKHVGGYLSVTERNFKDIRTSKMLRTTGGSSLNLLNDIPMEFDYIDAIKELEHSVKVEISATPSMYTLWEIQKLESFNSDLPKYWQPVRIKNVSTQNYLSVSKKNKSKLILHEGGISQDTIFYVSTENSAAKDGSFSTEDLIKIKTNFGQYIQLLRIGNKFNSSKNWNIITDEENHETEKFNPVISNEIDTNFEFVCSKKTESWSLTFEFIKPDKEIDLIARKISSSIPS